MKTAMREYIREQAVARAPSSPRDGGDKLRDFFSFVSGAPVGGGGANQRHAGAGGGGRVVLAHASSGYGQSLTEVLQVRAGCAPRPDARRAPRPCAAADRLGARRTSA